MAKKNRNNNRPKPQKNINTKSAVSASKVSKISVGSGAAPASEHDSHNHVSLVEENLSICANDNEDHGELHPDLHNEMKVQPLQVVDMLALSARKYNMTNPARVGVDEKILGTVDVESHPEGQSSGFR